MKIFIHLFTIILPLIVVSTSAQAQEKPNREIDLSDFHLSDNVIAYSNYASNEEELTISFLDSFKLDAVVLDNNLKLIKKIPSYELPSAGYTIQNTLINKTSINYLVLKANSYMSLLQYNLKTKKWIMGNNLMRDGENFLCSFPYQNKFYIFNFERKTGIIKTYTSDINGPILFKKFPLTKFNIEENNLSYFLKKKDKAIKVITIESPNDLFAAKKSKKAYQFNENIYLSIEDSIINKTGVIHFNLKSKKHSVAYYSGSKQNCSTINFCKTALSQKHFVSITGCITGAKITIWDIKSNKIIKEASLYKDSLIQIKSYDNLISPKQALSIEKLKPIVLLQKLVADNGSIHLIENKNQLEIIIGFSKEKKDRKRNKNQRSNSKGNGTGGGKGIGGGKQKKIDRINKRKIKGIGLSRSFLNYEASRPQYFVANYNFNSKTFDTTKKYKSSFENIKTHSSGLNKNLVGAKFVIKINTDYWFAYLNKLTQILHITKIE